MTVVISLVAGTAHADNEHCQAYLQANGYPMNDAVSEACWFGERGYTLLCEDDLYEQNVIASHAQEACRRAKWKRSLPAA